MFISKHGHMTKMTAMPIYSKNHIKASSPEPLDRFQRNLACNIGDYGTTMCTLITIFG